MEIESQVSVWLVNYRCDKCGNGDMISTGQVVTTPLPKYLHKCESCGHEQGYFENYPQTKYLPAETNDNSGDGLNSPENTNSYNSAAEIIHYAEYVAEAVGASHEELAASLRILLDRLKAIPEKHKYFLGKCAANAQINLNEKFYELLKTDMNMIIKYCTENQWDNNGNVVMISD
jgi:hypothetical protein